MKEWFERFKESVNENVSSHCAGNIMGDCEEFHIACPISKRVKNINELMKNLDNSVDREMSIEIIEQCGRKCIDNSIIHKVKEIKNSCENIDSFINKLREIKFAGGDIHNHGNVIYLNYPQCYCEWVDEEKGKMPAAYCNCSKGWVKQLFENVIDKEVKVELICSIIQGGDKCRFRIYLPE